MKIFGRRNPELEENLVDVEIFQVNSEIAQIDTQIAKVKISADQFADACNEIHIVVQVNDPIPDFRFP
ncbi:uncharacterized protein METZ01_LOCUS437021, partial [marine metagenome]